MFYSRHNFFLLPFMVSCNAFYVKDDFGTRESLLLPQTPISLVMYLETDVTELILSVTKIRMRLI